MGGLRCQLRHAWVVLAAIAGMLSLTGEAAACSAKSANKATKSCCKATPTAACCCETPSADPADVAPARPIATDGLAASSLSPCECNPGPPADPAEKPESPPSGRRTDTDRAEPVALAVEGGPSPAFVRIVPPTASPPGRPLYLLISRLLF
jgi:hypothetical protein